VFPQVGYPCYGGNSVLHSVAFGPMRHWPRKRFAAVGQHLADRELVHAVAAGVPGRAGLYRADPAGAHWRVSRTRHSTRFVPTPPGQITWSRACISLISACCALMIC
jgi:hypothetical protein